MQKSGQSGFSRVFTEKEGGRGEDGGGEDGGGEEEGEDRKRREEIGRRGEGWREREGTISRISYYHLILGIVSIFHVLVHIMSGRG